MKVDFKIAIWERFDVPEEAQEKVRTAIESGEIKTGNQLYEFIKENEFGSSISYELQEETEEYLDPKSNDGYSTIEIIEENADGDLETTWANAKLLYL